MNAVIDFNGYYHSYNQYAIKEYSLYLIRDGTNEIISSNFQIVKPPLPWDQLAKQDQIQYADYLDTYGIPWSFGDYSSKTIKRNLRKKLFRVKNIYIRDESKHNLLKNYLSFDFKAICLEDLGLRFESGMKTNCENHAEPWKNNCANDNVMIMLDWLVKHDLKAGGIMNRTKRVIVDFVGYFISETKYAIKELKAIVVNKRTLNDSDLYLIVKPPFPIENLQKHYFLKYAGFEANYGIDWDTGTTDLSQVADILTEYFKTTTHIYVENLEKQQLLEVFLGRNYHLIRLEDLGFKDLPRIGTDCPNHFNKNSICPVDYSKIMLRWFKRNVIKQLSWNDGLNRAASHQNHKTSTKGGTLGKLKEKLREKIVNQFLAKSKRL